jgi:hypothetical protein
MDNTAKQLLATAQHLFGNATRPQHFTNHTHCCECAEHDETLNAHTPQTIGHDELGNMAWDPICFATEEAFLYYFPALVRLTLQGHGETYYFDQFLFHVILDGPRNKRWISFDLEQRLFVVKVLEYMLENRTEAINRNFDMVRLQEARLIWQDDGH